MRKAGLDETQAGKNVLMYIFIYNRETWRKIILGKMSLKVHSFVHDDIAYGYLN